MAHLVGFLENAGNKLRAAEKPVFSASSRRAGTDEAVSGVQARQAARARGREAERRRVPCTPSPEHSGASQPARAAPVPGERAPRAQIPLDLGSRNARGRPLRCHNNCVWKSPLGAGQRQSRLRFQHIPPSVLCPCPDRHRCGGRGPCGARHAPRDRRGGSRRDRRSRWGGSTPAWQRTGGREQPMTVTPAGRGGRVPCCPTPPAGGSSAETTSGPPGGPSPRATADTLWGSQKRGPRTPSAVLAGELGPDGRCHPLRKAPSSSSSLLWNPSRFLFNFFSFRSFVFTLKNVFAIALPGRRINYDQTCVTTQKRVRGCTRTTSGSSWG